MATTFSTEHTLDFSNIPTEIGIVVKTNGGSLAITAQCGNDWVPVVTISEDSGKVISARNQVLRFTPSGGCVYTI